MTDAEVTDDVEMSDGENVIEFAGLTRHSNIELSERAVAAADGDTMFNIPSADAGDVYPDQMADTSFAQAVRMLEGAETTAPAWKVPENAARHLSADEINADTPDGIRAHETVDGGIFVETNRFQAVHSPDKIEKWVMGDYRREDNNQFRDPLWGIPSGSYTAVSPLAIYEPLEEAIRDAELGDNLFGEIRTYKSGGEAHMEVLFDKFHVDVDDDDTGPILLGIRTGYDHFQQTKIYAEGFAQDTGCRNSIRAITEEKSRKHVGDPSEVREWWDDILAEMDVLTDNLAEMIEAASEVEVEYLDFEFSELTDHNDDLKALFEMVGFPGYLAREAAGHTRSRADDRFAPTMWDIHSGATYALTHHYSGGENTPRESELVQVANDLLMNPEQAIDQAEQTAHTYAAELEASGDGGDGDAGELDGLAYAASVEKFRQSIEDKRDEFETRQERLRTVFAGGDGEGDLETDGGSDADADADLFDFE